MTSLSLICNFCQNPLPLDQRTLWLVDRSFHPTWAFSVPTLQSTSASSAPTLIPVFSKFFPYLLSVSLITLLPVDLPWVLSVLWSLWRLHLVFVCVWFPLLRIGFDFYLFFSLGRLQTCFIWSLIVLCSYTNRSHNFLIVEVKFTYLCFLQMFSILKKNQKILKM